MKTVNRKSAIKNFLSLLLPMAALAAGSAQAHSVWIEDTADHRLVIEFGEFGSELETSPGYLDSLSPPKAWANTATTNAQPFEVQKTTNSFLLTGSSAINVAAAETDYEVLSATNKPSRKPMFYARWQPFDAPAATSALTLDLVPTATPGEMHLYFRGKPVAGETVAAQGPGDYEKEKTTDAAGHVAFDLTKPGFYLFTCVHHRETIAGFSAGHPYDLVSHNTALTLRVPETSKP